MCVDLPAALVDGEKLSLGSSLDGGGLPGMMSVVAAVLALCGFLRCLSHKQLQEKNHNQKTNYNNDGDAVVAVAYFGSSVER